MVGLLALALLVALGLFFLSPRRARPNLLLITLDTLRADHVGVYGAAQAKTPRLDGLAARGLRFEHAQSAIPLTGPSHSTILTGQYPPVHGVRDNIVFALGDKQRTLAEILKEKGYRTGAFVGAYPVAAAFGFRQGFDVFHEDFKESPIPGAGAQRRANEVADDAIPFLTAKESAPFFAWLHFYDPHAPYDPPEPYKTAFAGRAYDGEIAFTDEQVGRVLDALKAAGHEGDTVVAALADHGESLGEHGEQTHAILAYDSTLHIPLIVKLPGARGGTRVEEMVSQIDLVPTVLEIFHLDADTSLPGHSLVPLLRGSQRTAPRGVYEETYLPFYTYGWAKLRVLRRDRWKLIDAPEPELYDLQRDPRELSNLFEREPGIAHDMQRELEQFRSSLGSPEREVALQLDTATAERLRSLGYLAMGSGAPGDEAKRPDPKRMIDVHVGLERAHVLQEDRLYDQAEKALRAVLSKDPNNLAALVDLVTTLENQGRIDEAVQTVQTALKIDPSYARLHLLYAGLEARRGRREEALALVDAAIKIDPHFPEAKLRKAYLLEQLGKANEAEQVLQQALQDDEQDPPLNAAYAQLVELRNNDLTAAERRLRKAVARDPFFAPAWQLLGVTLVRAGRTSEAVDAYREALQRVPDSDEAHAHLGILLARQGVGAEAESHLREAIRLAPELDVDVHAALGAWLAEHGRLDEALQEYAKVLEKDPSNIGARNNHAIALLESGRVDEAEKELEALLREHPNNADAHNNLAAIALDRQDWKRVEAEARTAIDVNGTLVPAWSNLGVALDGQGNYDDAEKAFRRALELDPNYWQARNNLATTFRKSGRPKEAAALFEEVLQQVPTEPGVHLELGDLYFGPLAEPERARAHYNAVLRYAPAHPRAAEIRARLAGSKHRETGTPSIQRDRAGEPGVR